MAGAKQRDDEPIPTWVRWLIVLACAGAVGLMLVIAIAFLWPWIGAFG